MKEANKPGGVKNMAQKGSATKQSSTKSKPRTAQGQAELAQVVAQLAVSAKKLAQAADRLTEATLRNSPTGKRQGEALGTPGESATDLAASGEHLEPAEPTDLTALGDQAETVDGSKDG